MAKKSSKTLKIGETAYERIMDWSGGMNDAVNPALLNNNESALLENASLDEKGTLFPRSGSRDRFAAAIGSSPVSGLGAFYKSDGVSRMLIGAENSLYVDEPHLVTIFDSQQEWQGGRLEAIDATSEPGKIKAMVQDDPTFTRSSVAYKQDGSQVAVNVPRFEAGPFS